jgi:hypothetical protein
MSTKKEKSDISKKRKIKDELNEEIDSISTEISALSKSTKLKDILKKYKQIKSNLDGINEKVINIKSNFDSIDVKKDKSEKKDTIDDDTYDKYTKEITEASEKIDDLSLDEQILGYKSLLKKITICENYLKSKKMEIIECPEADPLESTTEESNDK